MKLKSRKLWSWLVWTFIVLFAIYKNDFSAELIQWYGMVSVIYIGGQSAVDIYNKKNNTK